jgi:hypothetical protein
MLADLKVIDAAFGPASPEVLKYIERLHHEVLSHPQAEIPTEHVLHGGMYIRTIRLDAGTITVSSLIRLATVLIVNGSTAVIAGDEAVELEGYNVILGSAGRKQVFVTRSAVEMTMMFATSAKTVTEAEDEVFAQADELMSRADGSSNTITITGE